MATYVMLTKLSPEALTSPDSVAELNDRVEEHLKQQCPDVKWLAKSASG